MSGRLLDWILIRTLVPWLRARPWNRMVWLPLPTVRKQLAHGLTRDWETGVHNLNQYLSYSLQFISVVSAANASLADSLEEDLLARVTKLANEPYDWNLARFGSANLANALWREFIDGIVILPQKRRDLWKSRYPDDLRFDTPARCACAGFWLWHEEDTAQAAEAFERIRELPQGEELYRIAETLADGETASSLEALASIGHNLVWLDTLPDPKLRPGTLQALRDLRAAAQDAATAQHARSDLNRASALGRANGKLRDLILHGQENGCLDPEWLLVKKVAERWQDIVAIDEFEKIEDGIEAGHIDARVIEYLRSVNQRYRWLGLILGGLHTLEEMGHDYRSAFWGQAEHVRVSYLTREATVDLVARPHPDFALEYADDLLGELYRLTYGQPYLLQRLCWELVNRWNERFLKDGAKTPRVLELAELEPILGESFFRGAEYYFEGVWENVSEEERQALRAMALRDGSWRREEVPGGEEVLGLMLRHDVVLEEGGEVRFASELVRRWILRSESRRNGSGTTG